LLSPEEIKMKFKDKIEDAINIIYSNDYGDEDDYGEFDEEDEKSDEG